MVARPAHGIVAGDPDNRLSRVVEVVADVLGEGALLVAPFVRPAIAARIAPFARTVAPRLEQGQRGRRVLRDDEARVEHAEPLAVSADGLAVVEFLGVPGHGDRAMALDAPSVEHPLQRDFEVGERDVGVHGDDGSRMSLTKTTSVMGD